MVIAPDVPLELRQTRKSLELEMPLFSDPPLESARALGIAFEVTNERYHPMLEQHSGLEDHLLPVPAMFLVDADKRIVFSHANPDYRVRIPTPLILEAARAFAVELDE